MRSFVVSKLSILALALALLPAAGAVPAAMAAEAKHAEAPPGEAKPEPKKPPKPKPKKPDKEKNCGWETDIDIEIDSKRVTLNQGTLKNLMRGSESEQNGYTFFADTQKLVLKIRTPENNWYVADMTRLGDPGEGCIFYMVGEPQQVDAAPPLF